VILGLGDIIIPGIGINFFKKIDERIRNIKLHGFSCIGYFIGMAVCNFILAFTRVG